MANEHLGPPKANNIARRSTKARKTALLKPINSFFLSHLKRLTNYHLKVTDLREGDEDLGDGFRDLTPEHVALVGSSTSRRALKILKQAEKPQLTKYLITNGYLSLNFGYCPIIS